MDPVEDPHRGIEDDPRYEDPEAEFNERIEEHVRILKELFTPEFRAQSAKVQKAIDAIGGHLDLNLEARMQFDTLETRRERVRNEPNVGDQLKELMEKMESERQAREQVAKLERTKRTRMRRIAVAVVFALVVGGGGLIYYFFILNDEKKPQRSDSFTDDEASKFEKMLADWRALPEAEFWERIIAYVERDNPSLEEQMVMMGYIKNWCDPKAPVLGWTASEKLDAVEALEAAYNDCKDGGGLKSGALYRKLKTITYKAAALPRINAADICDIALAVLMIG